MNLQSDDLAKQSPVTKTILAKTGVVFVFNLVGLALGYVIHFILARSLGPTSYGTFSLARTTMHLLMVTVLMGVPPIIVRFASKYYASQDVTRLKTFLKWSHTRVLSASMIVLLLGLGLCKYTSLLPQAPLREALMVALCLLPLNALVIIHRQVLRAMNHLKRSSSSRDLLNPLFTLVFLALFWDHYHLSPVLAMSAFLLATLIELIISSFWLQISPRHDSRKQTIA